jgi:tetratricopeptide (TPR) repeat protein
MIKRIQIIFFLLLSVSAWSQNKVEVIADSVAVSGKETVSFETYYYEALKEKVKGDYGKAVELLRLSLRYQPQNADVQFELSINYKALKDYHQAILFGENAVRFNPDQKWYWLNIAELYSLVGDDGNAQRCYAKLSEFDADFIPEYIRSVARTGKIKLALEKVNLFLENQQTDELLIIKRDLLVANGLIDQAIAITEGLIIAHPNGIDNYIDISGLLLKSEKIEEAGNYVEQGLAVAPDNPQLLRLDFKILMQESDYKKAFEILDRVFESHRFDFNEKLNFVIEFVNNDQEHKQTYKLINSLEKWVADSHEIKVYPIIANLYNLEKDKEKALSTFRKGFEKGYTDFSGLMDMLVLEQELGKYKLLKNDTEKILELYPSQPIVYLFKGLAENQIGEFEVSVNTLSQGVDYVVNNDKLKSEFRSLIADGYYRMDKLDKSFAEFDKAISLNAENIVVLNNYSYYLSVNGMHLDKALEMIKQVIEAEPNSPTYLDTMAWVYYKRGEYEKAETAIKKALNNGGDKSSGILEHYGDILYRSGSKKQAVKQWKKALKQNQSSETLKNKIDNKAIGE